MGRDPGGSGPGAEEREGDTREVDEEEREERRWTGFKAPEVGQVPVMGTQIGVEVPSRLYGRWGVGLRRRLGRCRRLGRGRPGRRVGRVVVGLGPGRRPGVPEPWSGVGGPDTGPGPSRPVEPAEVHGPPSPGVGEVGSVDPGAPPRLSFGSEPVL